ncbi:unnamed protein product [Caenorhabditis nigoni]
MESELVHGFSDSCTLTLTSTSILIEAWSEKQLVSSKLLDPFNVPRFFSSVWKCANRYLTLVHLRDKGHWILNLRFFVDLAFEQFEIEAALKEKDDTSIIRFQLKGMPSIVGFTFA